MMKKSTAQMLFVSTLSLAALTACGGGGGFHNSTGTIANRIRQHFDIRFAGSLHRSFRIAERDGHIVCQSGINLFLGFW
jgi:hypothetical protein